MGESKKRAIVEHPTGASPVAGIVDGEENMNNIDMNSFLDFTCFVYITEIKRAQIFFGGSRGLVFEDVVRVEGKKPWYFANDFTIF